jgi:hypothetical protein
MNVPKVFEFITKFMTDDAFRFEVLRKEMTAMTGFGLTLQQAGIFRSLNSTLIKQMLQEEARNAGADVDKTFGIVYGLLSCDPIATPGGGVPSPALAPGGATMAAMSMYEEGQIHIRCVDPSSAPAGAVTTWFRAHGLAPNVEFEFRLGTNGSVIAPAMIITAPAVGDDLFQRVQVQANLTSGTWYIYGRNPDEGDFDMTAVPIKSITIT